MQGCLPIRILGIKVGILNTSQELQQLDIVRLNGEVKQAIILIRAVPEAEDI